VELNIDVDVKRGFPPALWLESGAVLTIKVESNLSWLDDEVKNDLLTEQSTGPIGRLVAITG
jgi:hypothetical protein